MEITGLEFKRIKLSAQATQKLGLFKSRTGLTPNIACRLALGFSISDDNNLTLDLHTEETGQEINRYTLLGEHEDALLTLFLEWCRINNITPNDYYKYFKAHINRGVEKIVNRVKSIDQLINLLPKDMK